MSNVIVFPVLLCVQLYVSVCLKGVLQHAPSYPSITHSLSINFTRFTSSLQRMKMLLHHILLPLLLLNCLLRTLLLSFFLLLHSEPRTSVRSRMTAVATEQPKKRRRGISGMRKRMGEMKKRAAAHLFSTSSSLLSCRRREEEEDGHEDPFTWTAKYDFNVLLRVAFFVPSFFFLSSSSSSFVAPSLAVSLSFFSRFSAPFCLKSNAPRAVCPILSFA